MSKKAAQIWAAAVTAATAFMVFAIVYDPVKIETTNVVEMRFLPLAARYDGAKTSEDVKKAALGVCEGLEKWGTSYRDRIVSTFISDGRGDEAIDVYFSYPINTYCPEFAK